jgi:hypothetical protein
MFISGILRLLTVIKAVSLEKMLITWVAFPMTLHAFEVLKVLAMRRVRFSPAVGAPEYQITAVNIILNRIPKQQKAEFLG